MPCKEGGSAASLVTGESVADWAGIHPYTPTGVYRPRTLRDLVACVTAVERQGTEAKAVGSVFSLSSAPDTDIHGFVIRTERLNRHLSRPSPSTERPLGPIRSDGASVFATPGHDRDWIAFFSRPALRENNGILIHVQAGVRIKDLLADLAGAGLALPTMGAGGAQTLAGAVSTGTHGGDVDLSVLGDAVRAVHLVGPGAQEWWIESNGGPGGGSGHSVLPDWCEDTKVIRDTDFLKSVVVGIGRFGVIYSMVLEVVPEYRLEERRGEEAWSDLRAELRDGVLRGYNASGAVFSDSRKGEPLRFFQVVVDPASGTRAWVTRRWLTTDATDEGLEAGFDALGYLCTDRQAAIATVSVLTSIAEATLLGIATGIAMTSAPIPVVGPIKATVDTAPYVELAADLVAAAQNFSTLGGWIASVVDCLRSRFDDNGIVDGIVTDLLRDASGAILEAEHDPPLRRGRSDEILDTHNYDLDGCFSVNSSEYFFDAESEAYVSFVDAVLREAHDLAPVVGVVAMRFMSQTGTMLGMQRFPRTVAIEVAVPRPGSVNTQFKRSVHRLALAHGGIPHWGQEHALDGEQVQELYWPQLDTWRWALVETEHQHPQTFSSTFTRRRGLEAEGPTNSLAALRARRYVAAVTSAA